MTDLEERLRATLHYHGNDIDPSTVRREYEHLAPRKSVDRRVFPVLVAAAVSTTIGLVAYFAWPSSDADVNQPAGNTGATITNGPPPRVVQYSPRSLPVASSWGVAVGIEIAFESESRDDQIITRGQLLMTDGTLDKDAEFYPQDGSDSDTGYPVPLEVASGVTVAVEATVLPACDVEVSDVPLMEIESRSAAGDQRTDAFNVSDLPAWQQAVEDWCASGVQAHLAVSETKPDGGFTQTVIVVNPGPGAVTVVCAEERDGYSGWEYAEVTVEGGATGELTTHGIGLAWDSPPPLTANGEPVHFLDY